MYTTPLCVNGPLIVVVRLSKYVVPTSNVFGRYKISGSQKTGKRGKPSIVYTYDATPAVEATTTTALNVTGYAAATGLNSVTDITRAVLMGGNTGIYLAINGNRHPFGNSRIYDQYDVYELDFAEEPDLLLEREEEETIESG